MNKVVSSTLSDTDRAAIVDAINAGMTNQAAGEKFGISPLAAGNIWKQANSAAYRNYISNRPETKTGFANVGYYRYSSNQWKPEIEDMGDCATTSIVVFSQESRVNLSYDEVADGFVKLKKKHRARYYPEYSDQWFEYHGRVPIELIEEFLEAHFNPAPQWVYLQNPWTVGDIAKATKHISCLMVLVRAHILTITNGVINDTWNSHQREVKSVLVLPKDVKSIQGALEKLSTGAINC